MNELYVSEDATINPAFEATILPFGAQLMEEGDSLGVVTSEQRLASGGMYTIIMTRDKVDDTKWDPV